MKGRSVRKLLMRSLIAAVLVLLACGGRPTQAAVTNGGTPSTSMMPPTDRWSRRAPDIARFMIAQLHGGQINGTSILSADSVRSMQTLHFDAHDVDGDRLRWAFFLDTYNGYDIVEHSGKVEGFQSWLVLVPSADFGVTVSWSNGDEDLWPIVKAILEQFLP